MTAPVLPTSIWKKPRLYRTIVGLYLIFMCLSSFALTIWLLNAFSGSCPPKAEHCFPGNFVIALFLGAGELVLTVVSAPAAIALLLNKDSRILAMTALVLWMLAIVFITVYIQSNIVFDRLLVEAMLASLIISNASMYWYLFRSSR